MKAFGKTILSAALGLTLLTSSTVFANGPTIAIGGVEITITGGALSLIGTVSTASLAEKHASFTYIGWGLIIAGALLDNKDVITRQVKAETVSGAKVWDSLVRQSQVLASNPALAKDDVSIVNATKTFHMKTSDLAQMVLDINAQVSASSMIQTRNIEAKYFANGFENAIQRQAFNNLVALASMN